MLAIRNPLESLTFSSDMPISNITQGLLSQPLWNGSDAALSADPTGPRLRVELDCDMSIGQELPSGDVSLTMLQLILMVAVNWSQDPLPSQGLSTDVDVIGFHIQALLRGPEQFNPEPPAFRWYHLSIEMTLSAQLLLDTRVFWAFKIKSSLDNVEIGNVLF